jgi:hypothetical protein
VKRARSLFRDRLEKLEQDRVHLQASVISNQGLFSDSEVRDFNNEYYDAFRRARKLADRNLKRMMAKKARSQFLCWDVLKKLRPSAGVWDVWLLLMTVDFDIRAIKKLQWN